MQTFHIAFINASLPVSFLNFRGKARPPTAPGIRLLCPEKGIGLLYRACLRSCTPLDSLTGHPGWATCRISSLAGVETLE